LRKDVKRLKRAGVRDASTILPTVSASVPYMPTSAWSGYRPLTESDRADVLELARREGTAVVLHDADATPVEVATPAGEWVTLAEWQARERWAERQRFDSAAIL
jgi:hypothetical protein